MSIERRRIENIIRSIIYEHISEGEYPPINVILRELAQKRDVSEGVPPIVYRGIIRSSPVNTAIDEILETIGMLYDEVYDLYELFGNFFSATRNEYKKLAMKERELLTMIDDILHSSSAANGYFFSWGDSFNNLDKIDGGLTTAQIRLEAGEAHLHTNLHSSAQVMRNQVIVASPHLVPEDEDFVISNNSRTSVTNAFDNDPSSFWIYEVETTSNIKLDLYLRISASNVGINHVEIEPYSLGPMQVDVEAIQGDEVIRWGSANITSSRACFGGDGKNVSSIRMCLRKDHYDFIRQDSSGTKFVYVLGAREIVMRRETYDLLNDVVSIPLALPPAVASDYALTSASLEVEEYVPSGTGINYYLGVEPEDGASNIDDVIWNSITPVNTIREDSDAPRTIFFFPGDAVSETLEPADVDGSISEITPEANIYRITPVQEITEILPESLEVFVGWNQGLVWREVLSEFPTEEEDALPYLELSYWQGRADNENMTSAYIGIDQIGNLYLPDSCAHLIEIAVHPPQEAQVVTHVIKPSGWWVKGFANNAEVLDLPRGEMGKEMIIDLPAGESWIHFIILSDAASTTFQLGTSLNRVGDVYLEKEATTDYQQLRMTAEEDQHYAAWYDGLVLNYQTDLDPNGDDLYGNYNIVTYKPRFFYRYYLKGLSEAKLLRFRAELWRMPDIEASPRLREYHVRVKYRSE